MSLSISTEAGSTAGVILCESGVELTPKELAFCESYMTYANAARAATDAGYESNHIRVVGYDILNKVHIKTHLKYLQNKVSELAGVTMLRNAKELAKIAYSSTSDLKDDWSSVRNWDDLSDDQKAVISEISITQRKIGKDVIEQRIHFKLHDKIKCIELLNKMFGFNAPEEVKHSGEVNIPPIQWVK